MFNVPVDPNDIPPWKLIIWMKIAGYMKRSEARNGLLLTCTIIHDMVSDYVTDYSFDKTISFRELVSLISRKDFKLVKGGRNILKFLIEYPKYSSLLPEVDEARPTIIWNISGSYYLRYAIENGNLEAVSFLIDKVGKGVNSLIRNEIIEKARSSKNEDIIHEVFGYFDITPPSGFFSIRHLISRDRLSQAISKLESKDKLICRGSNIQVMLSMLVASNELYRHELAEMILHKYDGKHVREDPLIEAMTKKDKGMTWIMVSSLKFDITVLGNQPIIIAARNGWARLIKFMVERLGGDPTAKENTPIVDATTRGNYNVVKYLLTRKEVDPSCYNNYPLDEALRRGHTKIVELLKNDPRVIKPV